MSLPHEYMYRVAAEGLKPRVTAIGSNEFLGVSTQKSSLGIMRLRRLATQTSACDSKEFNKPGSSASHILLMHNVWLWTRHTLKRIRKSSQGAVVSRWVMDFDASESCLAFASCLVVPQSVHLVAAHTRGSIVLGLCQHDSDERCII